ncbi:MAG: (deoxy)nucleoside triphosphate pyrophosphohydrolase, partial [Bacilli bacterium]|nr:(deoxy)nucleoside triphosphate pyrophosphohydrolase [Bacilli bacterium]
RGPGRALEGKWEFPGGKINDNETKEEALIREIKEELDSFIEPIEYMGENYYEYTNMAPYSDFSITMYGFRCKLIDGSLQLTEHTESKWVNKESLSSLDFAPADIPFVDMIKDIKKDGIN